MFAAAALLALGLLPRDAPVEDAVDRIEVNHVYDGNGNLVIDQIIFWEWNARHSRFDVVDWRLLKGVRNEITDEQRRAWRCAGADRAPPPVGKWRGGHAYPKLNHEQGVYISEWFDERADQRRRVTAPIFLETWTTGDRELAERRVVPQCERRKLRASNR